MTRYRAFAFVALACVCSGATYGQDPTKTPPPPTQQTVVTKKALTFEDYKLWERIAQVSISNDGKSLVYSVNRIDADGYVVARKVDGPEKSLIPNASRPAISDTSKYAGYIVSMPKAEVEKNTEMKRPSPTRLGLRNLETGDERMVEDIISFDFLKDQDTVVAVRPKVGPAPGGSDLLVFNAGGGEPIVISNVQTYGLNESESLIAIHINSGTGYQAFEVLDVKTGVIHPIYNGKEEVVTFGWAKKADVLSVAIAKPDEKKEGNNHRVWRVAGFGSSISRQELDPTKFEKFPAGMRISEGTRLSLSEDGSQVALGIQPWNDKTKPSNPKDKAGVEIWHTKDIRVMPQQKRSFTQDKAKGILMVWNPGENSLKRASIGKDGEIPGFDVSTYLSKDMGMTIVTDGRPYSNAVTDGSSYTDVWVSNLKTGEKYEAVHKDRFGIVPSDSMRYFAYYSEKLWWIYDIEAKRARALHPDGFSNFENELDDHTVTQKPPASFPLWLDNDEGVIIHDQFDAWLANPKTGSMRRLTNGRKEKVRFRYLDTTPYEESPKLTYPMHFDAFDTVKKKDGVYVLNAKGEGSIALSDDVLLRRLTKSKDTDRMIFTMESFQKSPDIFVTNQAFTAAKPVSKLNPQQKDFHWGRTDLVPFKSRFGAELNGTLIYPADYDPAKKYPMVTYIYERLSDEKNAYLYPSEWSAYNQQYFSHNGYFVFMPDIAYKGNRPGESAVDCLEPAVDAVLKMNVGVDPKKVGLIGHSWGGYQTAFVTTVSDRFAIGACGAPLTELTSMYNSFYWNSGSLDQPLMETGQGRMRVPFWEDPKAYFDNSPVWQSAKRKTPLLMAQGDADGAVDFHQAQYLFNTLRRMGKNCVLLMYAGENHNFTLRPDQLDYAKRLRHWMDVYLKDAKPEAWVTEGVPFVKQAGG